MNPESKSQLERAEFYLCLARAFLAPGGDGSFDAMREVLADDLESLAGNLGYPAGEALAAYREEMGRVAGRDELLAIYSALFLAPPVPVRINTGMYLDGAIGGGSVQALEHCYRSCGVQRSDEFHDLSDHVSVQLEFASFLFASDAERAADPQARPLAERPEYFLHTFVRPWLSAFCAALERAREEREFSANPYLHLARILEAAVERDALPSPEALQARTKTQAGIEQARATWAERGITDKDLKEIEKKLKEKGLSTDHLSIPVELRDEAQGWQRKTPPAPRRKM